mmetsp:Transcript_11791/g.25121  ORF Transcript_11791/g.25121 Transcript_11791/m.25121 type:complete len:411 (+) Transcript_11791:69-1301(+)
MFLSTAILGAAFNTEAISTLHMEKSHAPCFIASNVAFKFQSTLRKCRTMTASAVASLPRAADEEMIDPEMRETNESLRQSIQKLVSIINEPQSLTPPPTNNPSASVVHIIGTGLTPTLLNLPLSTLHILSEADVVLYDSLGLSYKDICQIVPKHCDVISVGKRGDKKSWKQKDIDELLIQVATETILPATSDATKEEQSPKSKTIVRLKGGDPFLFGRTRTEIENLRSHNIPYTYTPGISSCIAGPHLGGIPLTDALLDCQSFGVWSGTDAFGRSWGLMDNDSSEGRQWRGLDVDVLVFLMIGRLDKLEALCRSIANGNDGVDYDKKKGKWSKDTPCAIIQNAGGRKEGSGAEPSLPIQRVWRSTLEHIVADVKEEDETRTSVSPAVFIVGATAALDLLSQDDTPRDKAW